MSIEDLLSKADEVIKDVGQLGKAIQDMNVGAAPRLLTQALITGRNPFDQRPVSPYATDFIKYQPKHKFLFKVIFTFQSEYQGNFKTREFNFLVKSIDKPKVQFEYEDVNFYNYRTKVLKKITYNPLHMEFIDDIENTVVDFFEFYRRAYSPITYVPFTAADPRRLEQIGFDFAPGRARGLKHGYSAGVGTLEGGHRDVLKNIKLVQYYAHGTRHNVYFFVNPRINNMDFDGPADHAAGDSGHGLTVDFEFDYMYVEDYITTGNHFSFGRYDIFNGGGISGLTDSILNSLYGYPDETIGSNRNIFSGEPGGINFGNLPNIIGGAIGGVISAPIKSAANAVIAPVSKAVNSVVSGAKDSLSRMFKF